MKKFATVLLAIVLSLSALTFAACQPKGGNLSDEDVIGVWKDTAFSVTINGENFYAEGDDFYNMTVDDLPYSELLKQYHFVGVFWSDVLEIEFKEDKSISHNLSSDFITNASSLDNATWKIENGNVVISTNTGFNDTVVFKPNKDGRLAEVTDLEPMNRQFKRIQQEEGLPDLEISEYLVYFTKQ